MAKTYASDVQLESDQPIAYEQQDGIKQPFAEAHRDYVSLELAEAYEEQTGRGSGMVREDAMTQDMRPTPELAAEADRESFDDRWNNELLEASNDQVQAEQQRGDRQHENELSR